MNKNPGHASEEDPTILTLDRSNIRYYMYTSRNKMMIFFLNRIKVKAGQSFFPLEGGNTHATLILKISLKDKYVFPRVCFSICNTPWIFSSF